MRVLVLIAAVLAFAAGLVIDSGALLSLAWLCLSGRCGVAPRWLALGAAMAALAGGAAWLIRRRKRKRRRRKRAAPRRKAAPPPP
ncbi:MAG TPA: LPXTG cell wall anchor domain-containing protein [Acetobacteraceae bacterium]